MRMLSKRSLGLETILPRNAISYMYKINPPSTNILEFYMNLFQANQDHTQLIQFVAEKLYNIGGTRKTIFQKGMYNTAYSAMTKTFLLAEIKTIK